MSETRPQSNAVRRGLVVAALVVAALYLPLLRADGVGTFHDDGVYLVTAKALAEGQGYRIQSLPSAPAQTKYPVLFPWLLSLVWRVAPGFPQNLAWLKLVPLGAALAWALLSLRLLRVLGASAGTTACIGALLAVSPWVAYLSTTLLSETVFAALVVAGVASVTAAAHPQRGRVTDALLAGGLAGAATLTRSAGIALAAACLLALCGRRRWRACAACALGMSVLLVPWYLWVYRQNAAAALADSYYSASNYGSWNVLANYSFPEKFDVVATNVLLVGYAPAITWGAMAVPGALLVGGGLLLAAARGMWRERRQPGVLFVALYLLMLLLWLWPPQRFLIPILPLLAWLAWQGAGRLRPMVAVTGVVLFVSGTVSTWALARDARTLQATAPLPGLAEDWPRTRASLEWIDRHAPLDAVLAGNLDPAYYLFTGRRSVRAFSADPYLLFYNARQRPGNPLGNVDALRQRLTQFKVGYLLLERGAAFGETVHLRQLVKEFNEAYPGALRLSAGDEASGYVVYEVDLTRAESNRATDR